MILADVRVVGSADSRPTYVEIQDDRIAAVGGRPELSGEEVVDGAGCYVMPGLVNAHDHLSTNGLLLDREATSYYEIYRRPSEEQVLHCASSALYSLAHGITTVRDAGSAWMVSLVLRDALRSGLLPGPRVFSCGQVLSVPFEGEGVKPAGMTVDAAGLVGISRVIEMLAGRRVDFVKLKGHRRDFADGERTEFFSAEEIAFAGTEAHRRGLRFAVHAWHNNIVEAALTARVADSVEHGNLLVERPDLLAEMRTQDVVLVPNLVSWAPSGAPNVAANGRAGIALERIWDTVELAIKLGVRLAAGTDLYTEYLHSEASAYRRLGLSGEDALETMTTNGARLLGLDSEIGRIEPGYLADLILVDGDPRDDLGVTTVPHTVIVGGRRYDSAMLRRLVAGLSTARAALPTIRKAPEDDATGASSNRTEKG